MKKQMLLEVRGKEHRWGFIVNCEESDLQEWIDDGLDIFVIGNTIPEWVSSLGLTHIWCFFQNIFNFKKP